MTSVQTENQRGQLRGRPRRWAARLRRRRSVAARGSVRSLRAAALAIGAGVRAVAMRIDSLVLVAGVGVLVWAAADFGEVPAKVALGAGLLAIGFPWEGLAAIMDGRRGRRSDR